MVILLDIIPCKLTTKEFKLLNKIFFEFIIPQVLKLILKASFAY